MSPHATIADTALRTALFGVRGRELGGKGGLFSVGGTDPEAAETPVNVFGSNVELSFTIPAGETGPSGGVSSTDVTNAIANEIFGTARNPNSVAPLPFTVSNPPTQAELQAVVDKLNELIGSLQR